ncbi:hypothetical protein KKC17_03490 [Patescibacteria group bacterium]|nr:hypothetical protein [Patescibacteria group bacterium]
MKLSIKKSTKNKIKSNTNKVKDEITEELRKLGDKIMIMTKEAKVKYDQSDEQTKKKILTGVIGAATILSGIIGYKVIKGKKSK